MRLTTKNGYELGRVISAIQKGIRRQDARIAGFFAMEAHISGFGAYAWRRLLIISAEDCAALVTSEVMALYQAWELCRKAQPERERWKLAGRIFMAKAVILLCTAAKTRDADHLANLVHEAKGITDAQAQAVIDKSEPLEVPAYADDCHTGIGRRRGLTRSDFFLAEHAALQPRARGLFDQEVDRLASGELTIPDRTWQERLRS
jgi:replication-associated recombination protein RarA